MKDKTPREHDLADEATSLVSQNVLLSVDEDDIQKLVGAHERANEHSIIGRRDTKGCSEQRFKRCDRRTRALVSA